MKTFITNEVEINCHTLADYMRNIGAVRDEDSNGNLDFDCYHEDRFGNDTTDIMGAEAVYLPRHTEIDGEDLGGGKYDSERVVLLYDNYRSRWLIAHTSGEDVTPEIVNLLIQLGVGVPLELALRLDVTYCGSLADETHTKNCLAVYEALQSYFSTNIQKAKTLLLKQS